jgi:hypothetical protein
VRIRPIVPRTRAERSRRQAARIRPVRIRPIVHARSATPVNPAPDYFVMTVHPPRMDRDGYVEFTLTHDARCGLEREAARAHAIKGIRLPTEACRRGRQ